MSKNLSQLARRKGIDNTLFQQLVVTDAGDKSANLKQQRQALAKQCKLFSVNKFIAQAKRLARLFA